MLPKSAFSYDIKYASLVEIFFYFFTCGTALLRRTVMFQNIFDLEGHHFTTSLEPVKLLKRPQVGL